MESVAFLQSYLEPNSNTMQQPIGGLSEKIEDRSAIGGFRNQKHVETSRGFIRTSATGSTLLEETSAAEQNIPEF